MTFKHAAVRIGQILLFGTSYIWIPILYGWSHKFGNLKYLSKNDYKIWKNSMHSMLQNHVKSGYTSRLNELIPAFATTRIKVVKKECTFDKDIPIVVLCVKNDIRRLKLLVEHYRKYGIDQFAFLDNGSTDGTLEWMLKQHDIDVFSTDRRYTSFTKEAWINRLISVYGFDRWYLVTDSDEIVIYSEIEKFPFPCFVNYLENKGIRRVKGLTLDMYADSPIFSCSSNSQSIQDRYCWTDTDSFFEEDLKVGGLKLKKLSGGPRFRKMNVRTSLSKYPIVYFEPGTISENAHFQFPYEPAVEAPCYLGILHYKFLDEDRKVFKERSKKNSGFARGGGDYKNYMNLVEKDNNATFMYEGSIRMLDSCSLEKIPFITSIDFKNY